MPTVYTVEQAELWFRQAKGGCFCVRPDGTGKTCYNLDEAKQFFERKGGGDGLASHS
jgi:hypothetical protein